MKIINVILFLCITATAVAVTFEELDKPPEGAHKGQMLLGVSATVGVPYGKIISAEHNYIRNSTYTFADSLITKKIMLRHLFFSYGLSFEYMPVDHLGLKVKARRSTIVQTTMFGPQYQNWSRLIYGDYTFLFGSSVHVTTRKQWDISFTPFAGYSIGQYTAASIARQLVYRYQIISLQKIVYGYGGKRKKKADSPIVGGEISILIYFSGGFFLSMGTEWTMNILEFGNKYYLMNPQTYEWFYGNRKSSYLHSVCFILSAGYAFLN